MTRELVEQRIGELESALTCCPLEYRRAYQEELIDLRIVLASLPAEVTS